MARYSNKPIRPRHAIVPVIGTVAKGFSTYTNGHPSVAICCAISKIHHESQKCNLEAWFYSPLHPGSNHGPFIGQFFL